MQHLSDHALDELEVVAEAATDGPWVAKPTRTSFSTVVGPVAEGRTPTLYLGAYGDLLPVDAVFIATARAAVSALVADLRAARAELAKLRESKTSSPKSSPQRRRSGGASSS